MIDDLVRQQSKLQKQVDGLVKPELSPDLISPFLSIPGLVGFWPMSSVQRSSGNAYDQSGQARTLTYNGNPTYNYYNNIVPYIDFDGVGDYLSRVDETDLDVLGTETIYAAGVRGLTLGGWFWFNNGPGAIEGCINKDVIGTNNRSYGVRRNAAGDIISYVSSLGTGASTVTSPSTSILSTAQWYFLVGRFIPSTEVTIWSNSEKLSNLAGVPAAIFSGTANLAIGAIGAGTSPMTGRASLCFLSANALSDAKISSIFQQTRGAFGV